MLIYIFVKYFFIFNINYISKLPNVYFLFVKYFFVQLIKVPNLKKKKNLKIHFGSEKSQYRAYKLSLICLNIANEILNFFFGEIKTNKFINLENQNCFLSLSFWTQTQVTKPFCTQNVVTLAYVELSKAATWTTNVSNYSQHITARKPKLFTSKEEYSFSKLQIFSAM